MSSEVRQIWTVAGLSLALLLLVLMSAYRETLAYLIGLWNELRIGEYAHGYLVLAISVFLVVRDRRALAVLMPCPNYWALAGVLAAGLLWTAAALADVLVAQAVALWLLALAVVWTVLGTEVTRKVLFPILFIAFALPIWFPLSPLLQDLTADAVFDLVRMLRIPALQQENRIVLPAGTLLIGEACSGLRYLLAALTLGTLYAYLNYVRLGARLLVVLIAAAAALLANMLRVFIVVYLGYATDMQHSLIRDHLTLGWYLFAGLVVLLVVVDTRVRRHHATGREGTTVPRTELRPGACAKTKFQRVLLLGAAAVLVAAGPAAVNWISHQPSVENELTSVELPSGTGGWRGPLASDDDWMPEFHGAITRMQVYQETDNDVYLYVGYYPLQQQDRELINELNRISNPGVWHTRYPRGRLRYAGDLPVLEQVLEKGETGERLVWYWYRVAGHPTTNKYQAKLLQVVGRVTGQPQAFVTAAAVDIRTDIDHARQVLNRFVSAMQQPLAGVGGNSADPH